MPWTIWPSLAILWGVCWMFYPPEPGDYGSSWNIVDGSLGPHLGIQLNEEPPERLEPSILDVPSQVDDIPNDDDLGILGLLDFPFVPVLNTECDMPCFQNNNEVVTGILDQGICSFSTQSETRINTGYKSDSIALPQSSDYWYAFRDEPAKAVDSSCIASPSLGVVSTVRAGSYDVVGADYAPTIAEPANSNTKHMPLQGRSPILPDHGVPVPSASVTGNDNLNGLRHSLKRCPYEGCGESFSTNGTLSKHIIRHERPFSCDKCDRRFGSKKDLERHELTVHKQERSFICPESACSRGGKPFSRRDNFLKHLREVHGRKADMPEPSSLCENKPLAIGLRKRTREESREEERMDDDSLVPSTLFHQLREELRMERARFDLQLHELQRKSESEMTCLRERHERDLKEQREKYEAELKDQKSRHQVIEDRLWRLIGKG